MEQQKDTQQQGFVNKGQAPQGSYHPPIERRDNPLLQKPQPAFNHQRASAIGVSVKPAVNPKNESQSAGRTPASGFDYVVRKAEKLTTALYLVTDIMSEKEPMKWKAREIGVEILSDITIASSLSLSEKMTMLRNAMKKIEKTVAFLDVAQSARLMSEMNSSVLKREYLKLKDSIESEWNTIYEKSKSIFSESFFDIPRESVPRLESGRESLAENAVTQAVVAHQSTQNRDLERRHGVKPENSEREGRDNSAEKRQPEFSQPRMANVAQRQSQGQLPINAHQAGGSPMVPGNATAPVVTIGITGSPRNIDGILPVVQRGANPTTEDGTATARGILLRHFTSSGVERDDRRKIVLALIKQKPALTVKDIAKSIPHVSEKTIQRELLSMVAEGVLVKRGERRWSTYSLRA